MSYDVRIGDEDFNYTYNLADLFHDVIPSRENSHVSGPQALHGKTGEAAAVILRDAIKRIDAIRVQMGDAEMCRTYNAPNGWGTVLGGTLFLTRIMMACQENPDEIVSVS